MFKLPLGLAALAMTAAAMPTAATAQRYDGYGQGYERAYGEAYQDGYNRAPRYRDRSYQYRDRGYDNRDRGYPYRDDRNYRRCSDGTTGTIIGAIAGGLLGRSIDNRGDRATGTVLGGVGGALAGRAVERGGSNGCSRR